MEADKLRTLADKWGADAVFYLRAGEGDKCVAYGHCAKELRAALGEARPAMEAELRGQCDKLIDRLLHAFDYMDPVDSDYARQVAREIASGLSDTIAAQAAELEGLRKDAERTVYIDLDGVMADFDGAFPAVFGLDHRSMADDEMWAQINSHESFFRDLPPMAGALDFFRSIEHLAPVILTACPKSNYPHVAAQKRAWVREHLSATCLVLPVLGGRHKPLFMHQPGDILIDDFGKNCDAWTAAGGVAIKHEGDWQATRAAIDTALADSGAGGG